MRDCNLCRSPAIFMLEWETWRKMCNGTKKSVGRVWLQNMQGPWEGIARQHFFNRGRFKMQFNPMKVALQINKLYPDSWFTLGLWHTCELRTGKGSSVFILEWLYQLMNIIMKVGCNMSQLQHANWTKKRRLFYALNRLSKLTGGNTKIWEKLYHILFWT